MFRPGCAIASNGAVPYRQPGSPPLVTRPSGPLPAMDARSRPYSLAMRLTAGAASALPPSCMSKQQILGQVEKGTAAHYWMITAGMAGTCVCVLLSDVLSCAGAAAAGSHVWLLPASVLLATVPGPCSSSSVSSSTRASPTYTGACAAFCCTLLCHAAGCGHEHSQDCLLKHGHAIPVAETWSSWSPQKETS